MILDKDIPSIGSRGNYGAGIQGALSRAWRSIQDGRPLLIDTKGNALSSLRTGGLRALFESQSDTWQDLLDRSSLLDKDGKRIRRSK